MWLVATVLDTMGYGTFLSLWKSLSADLSVKMSSTPHHLVALSGLETCRAERVLLCCCNTHPVCVFGMRHCGKKVCSSWPSPAVLAHSVKGSAC